MYFWYSILLQLTLDTLIQSDTSECSIIPVWYWKLYFNKGFKSFSNYCLSHSVANYYSFVIVFIIKVWFKVFL